MKETTWREREDVKIRRREATEDREVQGSDGRGRGEKRMKRKGRNGGFRKMKS